MRAVGNHEGAFDHSASQDVIDTDAQQGPLSVLTGTTAGANADSIPAPNGNPILYQNVRGGNFVIASTGVNAIILAAPIAGVDDNITVQFQDVGGHAHTITSTGNLLTGSAGKTGVVTFPGTAGASIMFRAYNGKWCVINNNLVTLTS